MGRRRNQSKNTMFLLLVLILLGIGIAYAVLTEQLTINNIVSYDAMKWDVGFTSAEDGWETYVDIYIKMIEQESGVTLEEMGMSRDEFEREIKANFEGAGATYSSSTSTISLDKKSIDVNCNLIMTSKSQACMVKATITNDSTFNIAFNESPVFIYENAYILNSAVVWVDHELYGVFSQVSKGQTLAAEETADVFIAIMTTELTEDMLPQTAMSIPITVELSFEEVDYLMQDLSMLMSENSSYAFWNDTYRSKIKSITFEDEISISDNAVESWDISVAQDGRLMSYVVPNSSDSTYYDLHIQSDEQLYANFNMSYWFSGFSNLDVINGMELLDTSYTTDMSYMFWNTGYNSEIFTMDVSSFDTSNVLDLGWMFWDTGYNSQSIILDVSNFNTSNATIMYGMFWNAGYSSPEFTLDVSSFDTSNVTDMDNMFNGTGHSSAVFTLDVSGFDTSKVTDMSWMFNGTGYNSSVFNLDVSNFDTSNVTDMSYMFSFTGTANTTFTLDVSNFDTRNVTNINGMFQYAGSNSTKLNTSITIRNPNTIEYGAMFNGVATQSGSQITVNYTSETSDLVDQMIATKSTNSNVVKGVQVD